MQKRTCARGNERNETDERNGSDKGPENKPNQIKWNPQTNPQSCFFADGREKAKNIAILDVRSHLIFIH
jgi:hypothetical protein